MRDVPKREAKNVKMGFSMPKIEKKRLFDAFRLDKPPFR